MVFSHVWNLELLIKEEEKEEKTYQNSNPLKSGFLIMEVTMKKQNIVQKSKDFNRIIKKHQGKASKYFIINF